MKKCPFWIDDSTRCDYDAKSPQMLECHVSRSHTAKWDYFMRSLDRPYECNVCNWRLSSLAALKKHKLKYAKICGAFPNQAQRAFYFLILLNWSVCRFSETLANFVCPKNEKFVVFAVKACF